MNLQANTHITYKPKYKLTKASSQTIKNTSQHTNIQVRSQTQKVANNQSSKHLNQHIYKHTTKKAYSQTHLAHKQTNRPTNKHKYT